MTLTWHIPVDLRLQGHVSSVKEESCSQCRVIFVVIEFKLIAPKIDKAPA